MELTNETKESLFEHIKVIEDEREVLMKFKEEVFEIAFGDNAINRNFTDEEVLDQLRMYSDNSIEEDDFPCNEMGSSC